MIETTYRTADGRTFSDAKVAQAHDRLLTRIDAFLDANNVGATRRKKLRAMLVDWTGIVDGRLPDSEQGQAA